MQTKIMSLEGKETTVFPEYACSKCFAILDDDDKFCWSCGAELDTENIAYGSEDLKVKGKGNKMTTKDEEYLKKELVKIAETVNMDEGEKEIARQRLSRKIEKKYSLDEVT